MTLPTPKRKYATHADGPESERFVPLDAALHRGRKTRASSLVQPETIHRRSRGQALIIVALMMTVLILFVGLGVDVGNLMGKRAKLQSAVDASALSAAQLMADSSVSPSLVITKAYQMLTANGVSSNTLAFKLVTVDSNTSQVRVQTRQNVETFFMRIIPMWRTMQVSAEATADLSAYAEINIKPYGFPGVVNELNISIWGPDSWRRGGDAYSPQYISGSTTNPENAKMPYGYLYRIDVPVDFSDDHLLVQIFDPDTFNNATPPPTPLTPVATATFCPFPCIVATATPYRTPTFYPNDGRYTYCGAATERFNTCLKLNAFPLAATPIPTVFGGRRRVGFWRVDEFRQHRTASDIGPPNGTWSDSWANTTTYTLWHFDPHITSAFADPATLSDLPSQSYVAQYTVGLDSSTDLAWYQPSGFDITLNDPSCTRSNNDCYARESNGDMYFYIYVKTSAGSSENNFDLRVGPKQVNETEGYTCSDLSDRDNNICFANTQYFKQSTLASPPTDWNAGGAFVFAKRALPLNMDIVGPSGGFPMLYTQVSKNAAGQILAIRHFDQDCDTTNPQTCGDILQYQMQYCVNVNTTNLCSTGPCEPCSDLLNDNCYGDVGTGYKGPNNGWYCDGCPAPEKVNIPIEGSPLYQDFYGPTGQCTSSWLRLKNNPSYSQDTTVWEMPFARPRLIK